MQSILQAVESKNSTNWQKCLEDPQQQRTFLHLVVTTGIYNTSEGAKLLKQVLNTPQLSQTAISVLGPSFKFLDSTLTRKENQKLLTNNTRILTYDLMLENPEGYTKLLILLRDLFYYLPNSETNENQDENFGAEIFALIGQFGLEPFKVAQLVFSNLIFLISNSEENSAKISLVLGVLKQLNLPNFDVLVNFILLQNSSFGELRALALLASEEWFDESQVWNVVCPKLNEFQDAEAVGKKVNALAMAMPLLDDDDDEEILEEDENKMEVESTNLGESDDNAKDSTELEKITPTFDLAMKFISAIVSLWPDFGVNQNMLRKVLYFVFLHHTKVSKNADFGLAWSKSLQTLYDFNLENEEFDFWDTFVLPFSHNLHPAGFDFLLELKNDMQTFRKYLLPSLDLNMECAYVMEMDEKVRYALYTELQQKVSVENKFVKDRWSHAERDAKDVLKRLTKKDAEEVIVPQLLEVISRCPIPTWTVLLNHVENYNIGRLVAQNSAKKVRWLAMDMLTYVLLLQLNTGDRETQQSDGLFESKWFKLLAQFAGDIAVGHDSFDFKVIVMFVMHQFALEDFQLVGVVDTLFRRLCGCPLQSNLSIPQLEGLACVQQVSEVVSMTITEQFEPQVDRFFDDLGPVDRYVVLAALGFAFQKLHTLTGLDAKVLAQRRDLILSLALSYAELLGNVDNEEGNHFDGVEFNILNKTYKRQIAPPTISELTTTKSLFDDLSLYDVSYNADLYKKLMPALKQSGCDISEIDRASLQHRLRFKSVKQALSRVELPQVEELLMRILLSPKDALYSSRFVSLTIEGQQTPLSTFIDSFFTRGMLLTVFNACTPLEIESFSVFVLDFLHRAIQSSPSLEFIGLHQLLTTTILESLHLEAQYTSLSNCLSFMQRVQLVYPAFNHDANLILNRLELLSNNTTGDISTSVKSLIPQLNAHASLWTDQSTYSSDAQIQIHEQSERLVTRLFASISRFAPQIRGDELEEEGEVDFKDTRVDRRGNRRSERRRDRRRRRDRVRRPSVRDRDRNDRDARSDARNDARNDARSDARSDRRINDQHTNRSNHRNDRGERNDRRRDRSSEPRQNDTRNDARNDTRNDNRRRRTEYRDRGDRGDRNERSERIRQTDRRDDRRDDRRRRR